jgi:hypothetical protein
VVKHVYYFRARQTKLLATVPVPDGRHAPLAIHHRLTTYAASSDAIFLVAILYTVLFVKGGTTTARARTATAAATPTPAPPLLRSSSAFITSIIITRFCRVVNLRNLLRFPISH